MRLWDVETGTQRLLLETMGGQFSTPIFVQNGSAIMAKGGNAIRTWDAGTGVETKVLISGLEEFAHFAVSPDERIFAIRMADQSVRIRSSSTGRDLATIKGHLGWVTDLRFSPDSKTLLTGSMDGTAKTWDVRTGKNLQTFPHSGEIFDVAFSPDGEMIATGSTDETVKIWSVGKGYHLYTLKGHLDGIKAVAFSPNSRRIASGGGDNSAKVWNLPVGEPRGVLRGHGKSIKSLKFSEDSKTLFSAGDDLTTRSWSLTDERQNSVLADSGSLEIAPNGKDLAIGGNGAIRIWDLSSGKVRQSIPVSQPASTLAYSSNGKLLVYGNWENKTVSVWSTESSRHVCSFDAHGPSFISVNKDGQIITSSWDDYQVFVWDSSTCKPISRFAWGADARYFTLLLKDAQICALEVMHNARSLRLVSMNDGTELANFSGHDGEKLSYAAFSPKGDRLATSSDNGTIKIWDTQTGQELLSIKPAAAGAIEPIVFSPNGEVLAAAGIDGTIRLFRSSPAVSDGPLQIYQLVPKQLQ